MKKFFSLILLLMAFAITASADTVAVFSVSPAMSCQNCENKIKSNLRHEAGVKKIVTSLKNQTVTVTYDAAKTSPEAIAKGFEKIGYKATVGTAKTPAKQECIQQGCKMQPAQKGCKMQKKDLSNSRKAEGRISCCADTTACSKQAAASQKAVRK